jgi:solute carrier family 31 (copper transporter), member 1
LIAFAAIFRALLAIRVNFYPMLAVIENRRYGGPGFEPCLDEKSTRRPWRARDSMLMGFMDVVLAAVGYLLFVSRPKTPVLC